VAIAESTPGPIAVNSATFVGYHVGGFWGAFMATCGVVLPSFVIILIISNILPLFAANKIVQYVFFGIRAGILALICNACLSMYRQINKSLIAYIIILLAFFLVALFNVNSIYVILLCALIGLV